MNESSEELQQLAGEYVVGTLNLSRRQEVERRLPNEPALRAAVDEWERRLLPLTALAEPQQPSPHLWHRIEQSLPMPRRVREAGGWQQWWNSLTLWRWLAAGGLAATAMLAVLMANQLIAPQKPAGFMVVLVSPQDLTPGWIVEVANTGQLELVPLVQTTVPQQKALQFWTKGSDWQGPVSLGLVKPGESQRVMLDQLPPLQANQLFEITLEPSTGSTTGKPTGPVLYIGKAVKAI
jgi:anti-sigma-K factor RskA